MYKFLINEKSMNLICNIPNENTQDKQKPPEGGLVDIPRGE